MWLLTIFSNILMINIIFFCRIIIIIYNIPSEYSK